MSNTMPARGGYHCRNKMQQSATAHRPTCKVSDYHLAHHAVRFLVPYYPSVAERVGVKVCENPDEGFASGRYPSQTREIVVNPVQKSNGRSRHNKRS